jgi:hypothetical protein
VAVVLTNIRAGPAGEVANKIKGARSEQVASCFPRWAFDGPLVVRLQAGVG